MNVVVVVVQGTLNDLGGRFNKVREFWGDENDPLNLGSRCLVSVMVLSGTTGITSDNDSSHLL